MDCRQVVAEWAWISKEPGSPEDYGVLAASAGGVEAGRFTGTYVAGIPSSSDRRDTPSAPPWATFGSHPTSAGRPMLSMSVQDPWQGQDQALRPIWPRRFFLCRYDELAEAGASCRTLWDAFAQVRLPRADDLPITVTVARQSLGEVVTAIDAVGFERAAAIAAALLDGPVALTGTSGLRLTDRSGTLTRLAALDAVSALLPYGFRADLAVSTAVDNTLAHRMRLVLAEYASGTQRAVPLRGQPVAPRSELGRDYLAMLLDKRRWDSAETVVAHLWHATAACSFGRPEAALEVLDHLNRHGHRIRAVTSGTESIEASRAFFRDEPAQVAKLWHSRELNEPTRARLLRPLIADPEPLREHWDVVAADYTALLAQRLDVGDIAGPASAFALAETLSEKMTDRLLRGLIEPSGSAAEARPERIAARAGLLRQLPAPAPGSHPMTRQALRAGPAAGWQGQLVRDLLSAELSAGRDDRALAWATWLNPPGSGQDAPDWAAALGFLLAQAGGDDAGSTVRSLVRGNLVWASIALRLAGRSGRLHALLAVPGLADDLADLATDRLELRPALAAALVRDAAEQAIADPAASSWAPPRDERSGVAGSRLALAIYRARRYGMPAAQIIAVIGGASADGVTLTSTMGHDVLDDVLRELDCMFTWSRSGDGGALAEFRELICGGALGAGYGAAFWRSLNRRLKAEEAASRRLRRSLRRRFGSAGRRRSASLVSAAATAGEGVWADVPIVS